MGILDEAIREHLDLKRRRGADPSEVDRLEREALGPVRRGPGDLSEAELDMEGPVVDSYPEADHMPYPMEEEVPEWTDSGEPALPFDHDSEPESRGAVAEDWDEPPTTIAPPPADEPEDLGPEPGYETPRHHEIAEEWEAHERGVTEEPAGFEPDEPAPAPPAFPPPAPATDPHGLDQETAEYNVEDESEPPAAEGEDVLEETPEFLQDTPDHDRLWFEQRPPRDFDFDG